MENVNNPPRKHEVLAAIETLCRIRSHEHEVSEMLPQLQHAESVVKAWRESLPQTTSASILSMKCDG